MHTLSILFSWVNGASIGEAEYGLVCFHFFGCSPIFREPKKAMHDTAHIILMSTFCRSRLSRFLVPVSIVFTMSVLITGVWSPFIVWSFFRPARKLFADVDLMPLVLRSQLRKTVTFVLSSGSPRSALFRFYTP